MAHDLASRPTAVPMGQRQAAAQRAQGDAPLPANAQAMTGKLYRGETEGEVRGWLFDHRTNARVEFTGVRDPRGNGYLLAGRVLRT